MKKQTKNGHFHLALDLIAKWSSKVLLLLIMLMIFILGTTL